MSPCAAYQNMSNGTLRFVWVCCLISIYISFLFFSLTLFVCLLSIRAHCLGPCLAHGVYVAFVRKQQTRISITHSCPLLAFVCDVMYIFSACPLGDLCSCGGMSGERGLEQTNASYCEPSLEHFLRSILIVSALISPFKCWALCRRISVFFFSSFAFRFFLCFSLCVNRKFDIIILYDKLYGGHCRA